MDPGLIVLGALSVGASLVYKYRRNLGLPAKEGFDVIPDPAYQATVAASQQAYNSLTLATDPRNAALNQASMSSQEVSDQQAAVNTALGGLKTTPNSDGTLNLKTTPSVNPSLAVDTNSALGLAAFCEKTAITNSVFSDSKFAANCGVCLTGGMSLNNQPFSGKRGLYISSNQRAVALQNAETSGSPFTSAVPTIGVCNGASTGVNTNFAFALTEKELTDFQGRAECQANKTVGNGCATCVEDGTYTYVGKDPLAVQPVTFYFIGTGTISVSVGSTAVRFESSKKNVATLSETKPIVFNVSVTEQEVISVTVSKLPKAKKGTLYGLVEVPLPNGGVTQIPIDKILVQDDEVGGKPKKSSIFKVIKTPTGSLRVQELETTFSKSRMLLSGPMPFTVSTAYPFVGVDCRTSMLQQNAHSVSEFGADPCYKPGGQGAGSWTNQCLQDRIVSQGCTQSGNLYKDPSSLRGMDMRTILQTIQGIFSNQYTDNTSSKACTGKDIGTPCDPYIQYDPEVTGEITLSCINFLYSNGGAGKPAIGPTYTGPTNVYYSLDSTGKKVFCKPGAGLDPNNPNTLATLVKLASDGYKGQTGIKAIQGVFNDAYLTATNTGLNANLPDSQGGRGTSLQQCFAGLVAPTPQGNSAAPASIPKGRYVRVRFPDGVKQHIQIAQLAVYDMTGANIAVGKTSSSANTYSPQTIPERANDGTLSARPYPLIYCSSATKTNEYWMVDLNSVTAIKSIVFYNRQDCCWERSNGMLVEVLDGSQTVVWSGVLTGKYGAETLNTNTPSYNV